MCAIAFLLKEEEKGGLELGDHPRRRQCFESKDLGFLSQTSSRDLFSCQIVFTTLEFS